LSQEHGNIMTDGPITPRKLAILIFDDVEVLDAMGPFEVFAVTRDLTTQSPLFRVYTVAEHERPIIARNGLSINATYMLENCPKPDILLIPGGRGTRSEIYNLKLIDWIRETAAQAEMVLSVCTGALLLAKAGLLKNLSATTYHTAFDELRGIEPNITLQPGCRFVDNGRVITSAGVSAGIDMSLYVVAKLLGKAQAVQAAQHMEYEYYPPEKAVQ
jgi:transcriptional regulator GlxA family with amidase domain